jgi:AraC family transcriptional activator of tynA and feaB
MFTHEIGSITGTALSATLVEHHSRPVCRATFEAELRWGTLGDLELVLFENSPMDVSDPRMTADRLFVCRQVAGELAIEQVGREVFLESGDITLLDPLVPYTGRFFSGSKLLVLKIPTAAESSLASSFLAMLPPHAGKLGGAAGEIIAEQALDLVAVSFARRWRARGRAFRPLGRLHC